MDDHPLVEDIKLLIETIRTTEALEQLTEQVDFAFGQSHYLSFLLNLCDKLGLITQNAGKYNINEKNLAAFLALTERDKLHKMLSAHLSSLIGDLKQTEILRKLPTLPKLLKNLKESQDIDSFYNNAFPGLMSLVTDFISTPGMMDLDDPEFFDEDDGSLEEMMQSSMEIQMLISGITSSIFICCGLYFQIIQPSYSSHFEFDELDNNYVESLPPADTGLDEKELAQYKGMISHVTYIKPPSNYSITPIGAKLFEKKYVDGLFDSLIEPGEYDEVLEGMLLDRNEIETEDNIDFLMDLLSDSLFTHDDAISKIKTGIRH